MERMENTALRDLVWYAIDDACDGDLVSRSEATTNVLAALGLDDQEAKPPKAKIVCPECGHNLRDVLASLIRQRGKFKARAIAAEKALSRSATPESENTDG